MSDAYEQMVETAARVTVDPGDGTVHPDLSYVLIRGFHAMGYERPMDAARDMIEGIVSAIGLTPESAPGWRPIESAPRDGTLVLLYRPLAAVTNDPVVTMRRTTPEPRQCWPDTIPPGADGLNYTEGSCYPTHWMPLPAPPLAAAKGTSA